MTHQNLGFRPVEVLLKIRLNTVLEGFGFAYVDDFFILVLHDVYSRLLWQLIR
jgi:hypothetical protein